MIVVWAGNSPCGVDLCAEREPKCIGWLRARAVGGRLVKDSEG